MGIDPQTTGSWMFAAGMALATGILMRRLWRRPRHSRQVQPLARPSRDRSSGDLSQEVLRWQVEMHELARDLKGELDSKIRVFDALVRQAREERQKLEALLRDASSRERRRDSA